MSVRRSSSCTPNALGRCGFSRHRLRDLKRGVGLTQEERAAKAGELLGPASRSCAGTHHLIKCLEIIDQTADRLGRAPASLDYRRFRLFFRPDERLTPSSAEVLDLPGALYEGVGKLAKLRLSSLTVERSSGGG